MRILQRFYAKVATSQYSKVLVSRNYSSQNHQSVAIIGSGPAGFYTAQHILKNFSNVRVDLFEKLPVPFGLVRYGVAPDHPEVKNATSSFEEVAKDERCRFFGNVNIGSDVKATDLKNLYEAVVFAYGADDDKKLHIPGEDNKDVLSARSFVGWYNGLPAHANLEPNLNCETAVIVGHGNVALDVARILLAPIDMLKHTDICSHALHTLERSSIKNVYIVGRRSPLEVSFTIKELREQIKLPGCQANFHKEDFEHLQEAIKNVPRPKARLIKLMFETAMKEVKNIDSSKKWFLEFLKTPTEVIVDSKDKLVGLKLEENELIEENGVTKACGTGNNFDLPCGLIFRSIGYKSIKVEDGIPFDNRLGIIPNIDGRVVSQAGSKDIIEGLYCSGWVKHGPVGVIATTMVEAYATAEKIVKDLKSGTLVKDSEFDVSKFMREKGINYVTFEEYKKINQEEIFRGSKSEKPREKIISADEMIKVALKKE